MPAASTYKLSVQVSDFEDSCLLIQLARLICVSCSSGQRFACGFLQIPPRDGHPCRPANSSPCRVCRRLSLPSECALPGARSKKAFRRSGKPFHFGRDDWIRTSDLTHPKRARYQAAPRPVMNGFSMPSKFTFSKCEWSFLLTSTPLWFNVAFIQEIQSLKHLFGTVTQAPSLF